MFNAVGMGFGRRGVGGGSIDLTQGLVAHHLLNNNADDIAGTYDGTPFGGVDFQGDMALFDGVDDYIDCGEVVIDETSLTISYWARAYENVPFPIVALAISRTSGTKDMIMFGYRNSQVYVGNGSIWVGTTNYTQYVDGSLHHYVHTINGLTLKSYVDGVLEVTTTLSGLASISKNMYICAGFNGFYNASTSNIRLYSGAKDQTFIDALYAEGYYPKPLPLPTTDGLISYYPLTGTGEDAWGAGGNESGTEYNGVAFIGEYFDRGDIVSDYNGVSSSLTNTSFSWTSPKSFSFWASGDIAISNEASTSVSNRVSVYTSGGGVHSKSRDGTSASGNYNYRQLLNVVPTDRSYHFAFIYKDTMTYELYIDGVFYSDINFDEYLTLGTLATPGNGLAIGRYDYNGTVYYRRGQIKDLKIYDRALTQTDINNIIAGNAPTDTLSEYPLITDSVDLKGNFTLTNSNVVFGEQLGGDMAFFDGTDDYIGAANNTVNGFVDTDFTVALWAKTDQTGTTRFMTGKNTTIDINNSVGWCVYLGNAGNNFYFDVGSGSQHARVNSPAVNAHTWYHIVCTFNNTTKTSTMYIDGIEVASVANASLGSISNTSTFYIGRSATSYFDGKIANEKTYDRVLTQDEITALYTEVNEPTLGLIGDYPLSKAWRALDRWVAYNGTENGGLNYFDDAEFGSVANFDYVDDEVTTTYKQPPASFTYTAWFRLDADGIDNTIFGSWSGNYNTNDILIWRDASSGKTANTNVIAVLIPVAGDVDTSIWAESSSVTSATWHHLAVVYDRGVGVKIYINGVDDTQAIYNPTATSPNTALNNVVIGNSNEIANRFMDGRIRNARIYNRSLLQTEITDIYNYEKNFRPIDIDDKLIYYYPLGDNSLDNYGNQVDGTDFNGVVHDGLAANYNGVDDFTDLNINNAINVETVYFWVYAYEEYNDITSSFEILGQLQSGGYPAYNFIAFGAVTSIFAGETFTILDYQNDLDLNSYVYIKDTITVGWHHIGVRWNGSAYEIILDGVKATTYYHNTMAKLPLNPVLGRRSLPTYGHTKFSHFRAYNKYITDEQTQIIYNTEKGDFGL